MFDFGQFYIRLGYYAGVMVTRSMSDEDGEHSASEAVIRSVAEAKQVAPTELTRPLYEAVDPDSMDRLVQPAQYPTATPDVNVVFDYYGFQVRVDEPSITLSDETDAES